MTVIRQSFIITLLLFSLSSVALANSQCVLDEKWQPIEQDIAWSDFVDDPKLVSRVQLLNVWAIWCAPCRKELPILAKLNDIPNIDVHLLNMGDEPEQAQDVLNDLSITTVSTSRRENADILKTFGVAGIPLTVMFIDGGAAYRYLGILEHEAQLEKTAQCLAKQYQ